MKGLKVLLAILTIGCLVAFFSFTDIGESQADGIVHHIRLGLQASPWLILDRAPTGASFRIQFPALSWIFLAGAIALEIIRSRLGKQEKKTGTKA